MVVSGVRVPNPIAKKVITAGIKEVGTITPGTIETPDVVPTVETTTETVVALVPPSKPATHASKPEATTWI